MNRTVVITGTSSGIGLASVNKFVTEGWNVVATVRKPDDLTVHDGHAGVRTLLLDVDREDQAAGFAARALAEFGAVDALVNNAGYYHMGPLEASTSDQIHRQFQTNLFGLIALTQAFLPHLRSRRSGVIINVASISADQGYPYTSVYAASKAAVATLSEGLNIELDPFGISVKTVLPGTHATKIFSKIDLAADVPADYHDGMQKFFDTPQSNFGSSPEVTAEVIHRAATDDQAARVRYYSGPDGESIPRARGLLGPEWYWREFRTANTTGPTPLWTSLVNPSGDQLIERTLT